MSLGWESSLVEVWRQETMGTQADVERLGAELQTRENLRAWIRRRYPDPALRAILTSAVKTADATESSLRRAGVGADEDKDDEGDGSALATDTDALTGTADEDALEPPPLDGLAEDADAVPFSSDPWELTLGSEGESSDGESPPPRTESPSTDTGFAHRDPGRVPSGIS